MVEQNSSGRRCSPSELPESAKKLSWGAFWFSLVWGIFNNTWRSFLVLILPGIMNVILLLKGRQWAWENRKWDSEAQFDKVQRRWGVCGTAIFLTLILLIVGNTLLAVYLINATKPKISYSKTNDKVLNLTSTNSSLLSLQKQNSQKEPSIDSVSNHSTNIDCIINIIGTDGEKLLKTVIKLTFDSTMIIPVNDAKPKLKDLLITQLSAMSLSDLENVDSKKIISTKFLKDARKVLKTDKINQAIISEFIIQ